jgi:PAS domain S-box-containing protein
MMGVQNEKMNGKPSDKQRDKILDAIADGVFTVDRDNNITFFNRAAEKIIGISRNQAVGHKCFDVFRANICQTACALGKTIETGRNLINLNINPSLTLFSQKATKNG